MGEGCANACSGTKTCGDTRDCSQITTQVSMCVCDNGYISHNQECIKESECPQLTRGDWSNWTSWSQCTKSCDGGGRFRERDCDFDICQDSVTLEDLTQTES